MVIFPNLLPFPSIVLLRVLTCSIACLRGRVCITQRYKGSLLVSQSQALLDVHRLLLQTLTPLWKLELFLSWTSHDLGLQRFLRRIRNAIAHSRQLWTWLLDSQWLLFSHLLVWNSPGLLGLVLIWYILLSYPIPEGAPQSDYRATNAQGWMQSRESMSGEAKHR